MKGKPEMNTRTDRKYLQSECRDCGEKLIALVAERKTAGGSFFVYLCEKCGDSYSMFIPVDDGIYDREFSKGEKVYLNQDFRDESGDSGLIVHAGADLIVDSDECEYLIVRQPGTRELFPVEKSADWIRTIK